MGSTAASISWSTVATTFGKGLLSSSWTSLMKVNVMCKASGSTTNMRCKLTHTFVVKTCPVVSKTNQLKAQTLTTRHMDCQGVPSPNTSQTINSYTSIKSSERALTATTHLMRRVSTRILNMRRHRCWLESSTTSCEGCTQFIMVDTII